MFGQPAQQPATSSLFGAPSTSGAPSLFGAPASQPSSTPSLFGAPASQAPASSSLFGAPAPASKPTFSFGTPTPAPAAGGGGLFGSAAPASAPSAGGGLFGAAPASGGLFGSTQAATPAAPAGGLFGSKPLFGAPAPAGTAQPTASTSALGQTLNNNAASTSSGSISKRSKVNELPEAARSVIEGIDAAIRSQVQVAEELKTRDLGSEITKTQDLYNLYLSESTSTLAALSEDYRQASSLKGKLETDLADLAKITILIEGFKAPQSAKGAQAKAVAGFPFEFFSRKSEEFKDRLKRYGGTMDQIQQQLESTHALSLHPSAIIPTLKAQHTSFMALASAVAQLDHELKLLKDDYRSIWREKTGSVQDPFRNAGVGVDGVGKGVNAMEI